ncbi:hypothetical protein GA0115256_13495 [Streptomyces sp. DconLS]|nr:hypothetical protein GA0115258_110331 [Streptomyces sp. LamerLS-31b]SCF93562.1 hypothetical protein GA0115256_13495 [Streptomyces sp. DconLS]
MSLVGRIATTTVLTAALSALALPATVSHTVTPAGMCDLGHRMPEAK